jgi:hypothetical protein
MQSENKSSHIADVICNSEVGDELLTQSENKSSHIADVIRNSEVGHELLVQSEDKSSLATPRVVDQTNEFNESSGDFNDSVENAADVRRALSEETLLIDEPGFPAVPVVPKKQQKIDAAWLRARGAPTSYEEWEARGTQHFEDAESDVYQIMRYNVEVGLARGPVGFHTLQNEFAKVFFFRKK